ncbi:hypothetical protein K458DRAFT_457925 [Lentithecium fluviatile CBS 122367]|uniref:Uncharacterized protein n=1 Tax=Lentithecium fluviatile CBS 122367 TaxID=1168545 RepID=A0A6G1IRG5_9PLEO|nr:hypothetical protein K458DRAFT_457925 [Lentithecium fluviatile CBS 122367]
MTRANLDTSIVGFCSEENRAEAPGIVSERSPHIEDFEEGVDASFSTPSPESPPEPTTPTSDITDTQKTFNDDAVPVKDLPTLLTESSPKNPKTSPKGSLATTPRSPKLLKKRPEALDSGVPKRKGLKRLDTFRGNKAGSPKDPIVRLKQPNSAQFFDKGAKEGSPWKSVDGLGMTDAGLVKEMGSKSAGASVDTLNVECGGYYEGFEKRSGDAS